MKITDQDVLKELDQLLLTLGLQLEDYDFVFLTQAELYVELFKIIFPSLTPVLNIDFDQEDINDKEIIQELIDFLSKNIIKMVLDHISGERITKGDRKHILNLLQLLHEISKLIVNGEGYSKNGENGDNGKEQPRDELGRMIHSSPVSLVQASVESQRNSEYVSNVEKDKTGQGASLEFPENEASEDVESHPNRIPTEGDSCVEEIATLLGRDGKKDTRKGSHNEKSKPDQRTTKSNSKRDSIQTSERKTAEKSKTKEDSQMTPKTMPGTDHPFEQTFSTKNIIASSQSPASEFYSDYHFENQGEDEIEEVAEEREQDTTERLRKREDKSPIKKKAGKKGTKSKKLPQKKPQEAEGQFSQVGPGKIIKKKKKKKEQRLDSSPKEQANLEQRNHGRIEESKEGHVNTVAEEEAEYLPTEETPETEHSKQGEKFSTKRNQIQAQTYLGGKVPYRSLRPTVVSLLSSPYKGEIRKKSIQETTLRGSTLRKGTKVPSERNNLQEQPTLKRSQNRFIQSQREEKFGQTRTQKKDYSRKDSAKMKNTTTKIQRDSLSKLIKEQRDGIYDLIRNEKLDHITKMQNVIYRLDQKKKYEEGSMYMKNKTKQDEGELTRLLTIKSNYQDILTSMKRTHLSQRNEFQENKKAQKTFLKTVRQELHRDSIRDFGRLMERWETESLKFQLMIRDSEDLERKVLELYTKRAQTA